MVYYSASRAIKSINNKDKDKTMKAELRAKIDEIAAKVATIQGMKETPYASDSAAGIRRFTYEPTSRYTYHGTYLNPFSVSCHKEGEPYLWTDEIGEERAVLSIAPLYRHNGTKEDVNVEVAVTHWHSQVEVLPISKWHNVEVEAEMRRIVSEQSPTDYMKDGYRVCSSTGGKRVFHQKVLATAKERAIQNALNKAMPFILSFVPRDHSAFVKRREDYPASTKQEHDDWAVAQRNKVA